MAVGTVPERQEDCGSGDFDGDGNRIRVEVIPSISAVNENDQMGT